MPDFERVLDDMTIDLSQTPARKAYFRGYKKGKSQARLEVAIIFAVICFGIAAIGYYYT